MLSIVVLMPTQQSLVWWTRQGVTHEQALMKGKKSNFSINLYNLKNHSQLTNLTTELTPDTTQGALYVTQQISNILCTRQYWLLILQISHPASNTMHCTTIDKNNKKNLMQ